MEAIDRITAKHLARQSRNQNLGKRELPQRHRVRKDFLFQTFPLCPQRLCGEIFGNSRKPRNTESVDDGILPSFTDYGFSGEDWEMKVLEHEVGRADKRLVQKTFDFSVLKGLK